jgi:hypothetical protein
VFLGKGNPKARNCYARNRADGEGDNHTKKIADLEILVVDTTMSVVRAAIVAGGALFRNLKLGNYPGGRPADRSG